LSHDDAARQRLRQALASYLTEDELSSLVRECLSVKKQASHSCRHCGKQSYGEVIDSKGVASALTSLRQDCRKARGEHDGYTMARGRKPGPSPEFRSQAI